MLVWIAVTTLLRGRDIMVPDIVTLIPLLAVLPSCLMLCFSPSTLTDKGVYLENRLLTTSKQITTTECAVTCGSYRDCRSFGFEPQTLSCHLHTERDGPSNPLTNRTGWLHGNIDDWPNDLLGPCSNLQCASGERCSVHRASMSAYCTKDADMCPEPPTVNNAQVSLGGQQRGSYRTYTCNHGYYDVTSDTESTLTSCVDGEGWMNVTLNCSGPYIRFVYDGVPPYNIIPIPEETLRNLSGNSSSLVYLTKACKDSNWGFYESDYGDALGAYKVIIGGWSSTKSLIRACDSCPSLDLHLENNIVTCGEYRPLWISWAGGIVSVGKGDVVGSQTFLRTPQPASFEINHVVIHSHSNTKSVWLFPIP